MQFYSVCIITMFFFIPKAFGFAPDFVKFAMAPLLPSIKKKGILFLIFFE